MKDVAAALRVRAPSVAEMLRKLDGQGFVLYQKYEGVRLTARGSEVACVVKNRHETSCAFLELLNVSPKIADKDACIIEHKLAPSKIFAHVDTRLIFTPVIPCSRRNGTMSASVSPGS